MELRDLVSNYIDRQGDKDRGAFHLTEGQEEVSALKVTFVGDVDIDQENVLAVQLGVERPGRHR